MNTGFKLIKLLPLFLALALFACGIDSAEDTAISGLVNSETGRSVTGPSFVIFTRTADFDAIQNDPFSNVITMITLPESGAYTVDLAEFGAHRGDRVYITAFIDMNYTGGVPYPDEGDYIGFYIDDDSLNPACTLGSHNRDINITINRRVYDYDATIEGTISNDLTGELMVIAYAGSIDSLDVTALDTDNIMGYTNLTKESTQVNYSLKLMPFGKDLPLENVLLLALFDRNGNGIPDGGDALAFHTDTGTGMPAHCLITAGINNGLDITEAIDLMTPSGITMNLEGAFELPAGYTSASKPVFIMVAETDDPGLLFSDPLAVIKAFRKLDPGTSSFNLDLSSTNLLPGDNVMVIALWDKDNQGGFPAPTPDDLVGFYQNTDIDNFAYTVTLTDTAPNSAYHQVSGDWKFQLNKKVYDYDTSVQFQLDSRNRESYMTQDNDLLCIVVHRDGVNATTRNIEDINYVMAMSPLPYSSDSATVYEFPVFNALDVRITSTATMDSYIYVIYDKDGNGLPSDGDDVAAYWETNPLYIPFVTPPRIPKRYTLVSDTINTLLEANADPGNDPYGVRFLGMTY